MLPAREGSADNQWRLAGGGAVEVDGFYAPGQVGGKGGVQREIEAASKGERWRSDGS